MLIRPATAADHAAVWNILSPIIQAGDTYALDVDMTRGDALDYWFAHGKQVFVVERDGRVVGTYYIRPNQAGGGRHVGNCGYATAAAHMGQGVARRMCAHSLEQARLLGFQAMQFNFVVSTNHRAVQLWQAMGFAVVGRLPGAFRHPVHGPVDALVMFQAL